jgi:hypothetical protein
LCVLGATALVHAQTPAPSAPTGTNVLFGRVVDIGTDAAVGGAIVTLDAFVDQFADPAAARARISAAPTARHVMTTAEGYFLFRDLSAGRYSIAATALGYVSSSYPPHVVELSDSDRPGSVELRLWKLAAIGGRVIDERGEPVVGMPVVPLRRVAVGGSVVLTRASAEVTTDDRGVYRIAQLPPGQYVVGVLSTTMSLPASLAREMDAVASNPSAGSTLRSELLRGGLLFARRSGEGQRVGDFVLQRSGPPLPLSPTGTPLGYANVLYPGTTNPNGAAVITLGSGESREGLDIAVRFAPTVSVSGVVTGPDGPMTNQAVYLLPPGGNLNDIEPVGVSTAVTDARGAFLFHAVSPGEYELRSVMMTGSETTGEGTALWAAEPLAVGDAGVTGITVTMRPGIRISGRVEFSGAAGPGLPTSQRMVVSLQPLGAQVWRTLQAVVRPDGTFVSAGDPPGRYIINASSPPNWRWQTTSLGGRPIADEPLELRDRDVTDLVFTFARKMTRLSGSVANAVGAPDPDADVIVFPADTTAWREGAFTSRRARLAHATSAASFEFVALAPGEYYVVAVDRRATMTWQDPQFLERLTGGATRVVLGEDESRTVSLRTVTPRNR